MPRELRFPSAVLPGHSRRRARAWVSSRWVLGTRGAARSSSRVARRPGETRVKDASSVGGTRGAPAVLGTSPSEHPRSRARSSFSPRARRRGSRPRAPPRGGPVRAEVRGAPSAGSPSRRDAGELPQPRRISPRVPRPDALLHISPAPPPRDRARPRRRPRRPRRARRRRLDAALAAASALLRLNPAAHGARGRPPTPTPPPSPPNARAIRARKSHRLHRLPRRPRRRRLGAPRGTLPPVV